MTLCDAAIKLLLTLNKSTVFEPILRKITI